MKRLTRDRAILLLVLLITTCVFLADVFVFREEILPGPPYFISILVAAYFLSPGLTASVASYVAALKLAADWTGRAPLWLTASYFSAMVLVGIAGTVLAGKMRQEEAMAAERDRLRAEAEQRAMALDAANKELEAFSYSVSHDLRAPLRHISGFSQALLEDYADRLDDQGRDYIDHVRRGTQRMEQLIDDLLKLSKVAQAEMNRGEVDLSSLAESVAANLQREAPERQVGLAITPGMVTDGDASLLQIAIENLLGNAWKFTCGQEDARVEFSAQQQGPERVYYIRDNGAGFDMTYAGKLFGPFQRLHSQEQFAGTGIGLATVQRVIHRHGGRIWAEATVGKGATIYFTLG